MQRSTLTGQQIRIDRLAQQRMPVGIVTGPLVGDQHVAIDHLT